MSDVLPWIGQAVFWLIFGVVGLAIAYAAITPIIARLRGQAWAIDPRIKAAWRWVQRNLTFVAVAAAGLVALFYGAKASRYRSKQAKHIERAREAKQSNLQKAEFERDEANAAASKASAAVKKGQVIIEEIANEPEIATDDRVARINERLRHAARVRDRAS